MKKILRLVLAILIIWIILFVAFPRLGKALKAFGDSIDFKAPSFNFINNVKSGATNLAKEGIDNIIKEAKSYTTDNKKIGEAIDRIKKNSNKASTNSSSYRREEYDTPKRKIDGLSIRDWTALNTTQWLISKDPFKAICAYSGIEITDIKKMDYDHIIPLKYVHEHGAASWSNEKKNEYAFDPTVGVSVSARENRIKGAKGPSEYMPKNNRAEYCKSWFFIADKYNLSLDQKDIDICENEIKNKPDATLINLYK